MEFDENPAQIVAQSLDGKREGGHRVRGVVLPVDYSRVDPEIVSALGEVRPSLVIGLGLAPGREKITPEKIAVNYRSSRNPDNAGKRLVGSPIEPSQPDGVFSTLPVEGLVAHLNKLGIPASVSLTAGAYLCNNAMFVIVRESRRQGFQGGFIHIPCHQEWVARKGKSFPSLAISTITRAVKESILYCLESAPGHSVKRAPARSR